MLSLSGGMHRLGSFLIELLSSDFIKIRDMRKTKDVAPPIRLIFNILVLPSASSASLKMDGGSILKRHYFVTKPVLCPFYTHVWI